MTDIVVDFESRGARKTLQEMRDLDKESQALAKSSQLLARAFKSGTASTTAYLKQLGLTGDQAAKAAKALADLQRSGASAADRFKFLRTEFGLTAKQTLSLENALRSSSSSLKDFNQLLADNRGAQQLATTLGQTLTQAKNFSRELGLTTTEAADAADRLQQLNRVSATSEQRFDVLSKELGITARQFKALDNAVQGVSLDKVNREAKTTSGFFAAGLGAAAGTAVLNLFAQALTGIRDALVAVARESLATNQELKGLNNALTSVFAQSTGDLDAGAVQAAQSLEFVRQVADRTGGDFGKLSSNYTQLAAAATTAGINIGTVNDLFAESARGFGVLNLSAEKSDLAFQAISQVLGKNQLQLEELKGQLGESFPIAIGLTTKGLADLTGQADLTTAQLFDLISAGEISGAEFAQAFTAGLKTVQGEVEQTRVSIGQFQNQLFDLSAQVGAALQPLQGAILGGIAGALDVAIDEDTFAPLEQSAQAFQDVLAENPQIVDQLGVALGEVLDALQGPLITTLNDISNALERNPDLVGDLADGFVDAIQVAGALVTGIVKIVGVLAQAQANVRNFTDSLERWKNINPILINGLQNFIDPLGQIQRLLERIGAIAPSAFDDFGIADAVNEANDALDSFRDFNQATVTDTQQTADDVVSAYKDRIAQIELAEAQSQARLAQLRASGVDEATVNAAAAQDAQEFADQRVAAAEQANAAIAASTDASADQIQQIELDLANSRAAQADASLAVTQATEQARVDAVEDAVNEAERVIQAADARRTGLLLTRELELRRSGATEVEIAEATADERFAIERQRLDDAIALEKQRINAFTDGSDEQLDAIANLAQLENDRIQLAIDQEQQLKQIQIDAINERKDLETQVLGIQQDQLQVTADSIALTNDLLSAQLDLLSAASDLQSTIGDRRTSDLQRALDITRQLNDEDEESAEQQALLRRELSSLGVGARADEQDIERQILADFQQRAQQEIQFLNQKQALKRQELDNELQLRAIANQRLVVERQIAVLEAQAALDAANISGNQQQVQLAQQQLQAQRQALGLAEQQQALEAQAADDARDRLALQQQNERIGALGELEDDSRDLASDLAENESQIADDALRVATQFGQQADAASVVGQRLLDQVNANNQIISQNQTINNQLRSRQQLLTGTQQAQQGVRQFRQGGVLPPGVSKVHKDEYIISPMGGEYVVSQRESRRITEQMAQPMTFPAPTRKNGGYSTNGGNAELLREIKGLRKDIKNRPVQANYTSVTNSQGEVRDRQRQRREMINLMKATAI